jgi:hypothetical protein
MTPIKENVITASNATEITRPRPRRWSALSTGLNRKVSNIASATGIKTDRAQYIETMINISVPSMTSGDNFRDLVGTKSDPFDGCKRWRYFRKSIALSWSVVQRSESAARNFLRTGLSS